MGLDPTVVSFPSDSADSENAEPVWVEPASRITVLQQESITTKERERERVGVPDRSWINPASLLRDPESISQRATVQSWVGTSWRLSDAIGRISDGLAGRVKYPSTTPHENKHSPARRRQAASRDSGILSFFFCQTPIRRRLLLAPDSQLGNLPNN